MNLPPPPPPKRLVAMMPPPPPPKRAAPPVVAAAPPPPAHPGDDAPTDMAHVRRVTLNLIRYAACCPAELRPALERLADAGWQVASLSREDDERIFAYVDDELAKAAVAEYIADTTSIVDHHPHAATCRLCGQQHIRFEFTLRNTAGGRDHQTGSSCIVEYGLNVDGTATVEEARARLNRAISSAMRKVEREDWQAAHPAHVADMRLLQTALDVCETRVDRTVLRHHAPKWIDRAQAGAKAIRPVLKFYTKERFLTELRTKQVYGAGALLATAAALVAESSAALAEVTRLRDYWGEFLRLHGAKLDAQERYAVESCKNQAMSEDGGWYATGIRGIMAKLTRLSSVTVTGAAPAATPAEDFSDLPY